MTTKIIAFPYSVRNEELLLKCFLVLFLNFPFYFVHFNMFVTFNFINKINFRCTDRRVKMASLDLTWTILLVLRINPIYRGWTIGPTFGIPIA